MSSNNEQLQPTPFDVVQPTPLEPTAAAGSRPPDAAQRWVLPALGGLLLLAVLVVFWLPERVNTPAPGPASPDTDSPTETGRQEATRAPAGGEGASPGPDVTPWSDAQLAKLRKEAQEVLAQLLEVQEVLEEQGVQLWAAGQFAAVAELATAGDEQYRSREYEAAKTKYEEGLAVLQALEAGIPDELARQLAQANAALESGDLDAATAALDTADLIDPGNPEAVTLRRRVAALPQLLALLEQAGAAEEEDDLAGAIELLEQAAGLDPLHQRSSDELARVAAAWQQQRFNRAMTEGYAALDANRFETARSAFRRAAEIQPGSSEAASAQQEVTAAATAHRLASLQRNGLQQEEAEQWQEAVTTYEKAQGIDPDVLFAREGLGRSRDRARLDKQFRAAIDDPQRLSDEAVATATGKMLQVARQISPRGPVLTAQIDKLDALLEQANTPITVALRSDQQTEVIVYKVARLGKFEQRELSLRPGTYTAVGSRMGYRDVRLDFTITPDSPPPAVMIACTEAI